MKTLYAQALFKDAGTTLADLREAVTMLEDTDRIARRVFGGAHPLTKAIGASLRKARATLRAREAQESDRHAFRTVRAKAAQAPLRQRPGFAPPSGSA